MKSMTASRILFSFSIFLAQGAFAVDPSDQGAKDTSAESGQVLKVDSLKKKYWEKSDGSNLKVVQNRLYSKAKRFEIAGFIGTVSTDPFLTVRNVGGMLGYFVSEEFGINLIYWKNIVTESSALGQLKQQTGLVTNTNKPNYFYGAELTYSPIYGKLSLSGKMIIYYDFHLLCGFGMTNTETGNLPTPEIGLGQQTYLTKSTTLRLNYRMTYYKENIKEKVNVATLGKVVSTRSTFNDVITLGITQLF